MRELFSELDTIDLLYPTKHKLLDSLTDVFTTGTSCSSLNSARSAVAPILVDKRTSIGETPMMKTFLHGVFNARP